MYKKMNCQFCEKEFSTKSSLTYHKKTAKYCLEKQGKTNEEYKCCYCDKCFTTYQRVIEHQNISCKLKDKSKYEQDIVSIKEEFENYKKQEKIREKEKESYYQKQVKESKDLLKEKNDYIAKLEANIEKLEAKLEKFEDIVLSKSDKKVEPKEKDSIPIPLKEQMSSIIIEDIKEDETVNYSMITLNNVSITSRPIDHYVNASQLCQAGEKKFNDWIRLDTTKELINALESDAGFPHHN